MKFIGPQLEPFLRDRALRKNMRSLLKYILVLALVITVFAIAFHFVMLYEGQQHTWLTGFYWALTVMSTLGFGDIIFHTDPGRLFSIVVLLTGIVMLLIVLPFAFIRFFYAPWLEAQVRMRAPRRVPEGTTGHFIMCASDSITRGLFARLKQEGIPHFVLEPDPASAYELWVNGVPVVTGEIDLRATYEAMNIHEARLLLANREDTVNTNIALTVREVSPDVPVVAVAHREESVDVLELSGANHVLPLKRWLGEQLANRVSAGSARSHVIGHYRGLQIAELPAHGTPLVDQTGWREHVFELTGVHVVGRWERGRLLPARDDVRLGDRDVLVLVGIESQLKALDGMLGSGATDDAPVIVVGGGAVGSSAVKALRSREVAVHLIDRDPSVCRRMEGLCNRVFLGDAADYELIEQAGVEQAPSVVLTGNDDAMNIYLASYCRRLNPNLRIVSRITHDRNVDAVHRAGADLVLSYAWLGLEAILAILEGRDLVLLSEGLDLYAAPAPKALIGTAPDRNKIRSDTGLALIALEHDGQIETRPEADRALENDDVLILLGSTAQRTAFMRRYG